MSVAEIEGQELAFAGPSGLWRDAWSQLRRNPGAIVGAFFVLLFVVCAVFAPWLAPHNPLDQDLSALGKNGIPPGPSAAHWFGIDTLGRDEFSRILYGARLSLLVGVVSVAVGLSIGMLLGAVAGYFGGWVDTLVMRFIDVMLAIPGLLLAIGIVAALGPGLFHIMIAVGLTQIPIFSRLLRGSVLAQKENDFVLAARATGVRSRAILASHILPNAMSPVIVQGTLALATAIIDVAALSFLGLGDQNPARPEWGAMLTETNQYLQQAPWLAIIPGLAIVVSALGFNMIGDALREALDPKLRGRT
jgi:peptide/nickel transport system permease protein